MRAGTAVRPGKGGELPKVPGGGAQKRQGKPRAVSPPRGGRASVSGDGEEAEGAGEEKGVSKGKGKGGKRPASSSVWMREGTTARPVGQVAEGREAAAGGAYEGDPAKRSLAVYWRLREECIKTNSLDALLALLDDVAAAGVDSKLLRLGPVLGAFSRGGHVAGAERVFAELKELARREGGDHLFLHSVTWG
eukprot:jgi/Mesen1/3453/ME000194S02603